jgi:hypothetical protein
VRLFNRIAAILGNRQERPSLNPAGTKPARDVEAARVPPAGAEPAQAAPVPPAGAEPAQAATPPSFPGLTGQLGRRTPAAPAGDEGDPCAQARTAVADACSLAERMRALALATQERLRAARRAYDEHAGRRDRAAATADPRSVRAAKDEVRAAFRRARLAARDRAGLETAAREWLQEVDRINARTRAAARILAQEAAAESDLLLAVERLGVEADGARIAAESAAEACRNARITLATCEERLRVEAGPASAPSLAPASIMAAAHPEGPAAQEPAHAAADPRDSETIAVPAILPLLAGDRGVLRRLAAALGEGDAVASAGWELHLTDLVIAVTERAIDSAALVFPEDHQFWGPYTQAQCREITAALAALGYRYDGVRGFADDRVPGQRELSLALGYAGLDPMRVRLWPTEAELPRLFEGVAVDAGRFVAEAAGELTLGEMIDLLGRRAEELSAVWNTWGRIRPLLLSAI